MAKHQPRTPRSGTRVDQLLAQVQDLREQLEVERQIHEQYLEMQREIELSREQYANLYDLAPVGYLTLDAFGVIQQVNLTGAKMLKTDRAAILSLPFRLFVARNDQRIIQKHFGRLRGGKSQVVTELTLRGKEDTPRMFELRTALPEMGMGEDLRHRRYYATLIDITERKQAEKILQESKTELERRVAEQTVEIRRGYDALHAERQRLFSVLETLPVMICLLTPDYRIAFANRSFRERFASRDHHYYKNSDVLNIEQPHHWEVTTLDGNVIDAYAFPFTDSDGSKKILEMDIDISDRRRAEKDLQDAHQALEDRAAQLRALAAELTMTEQRERNRLALILHDSLQQMLVAAKYQIALFEGGKDTAETAGQLANLIDDCIETSRSLTAELSPPILHHGGLVPALEWLVQWMRDKHGLFVQLSSQGHEKPPENIAVLLFQAIRELLLNVIKHARTREARIGVRQLDERIQVEVADEGVGFDPEQYFSQADHEGSGMGLFSIRERLGYFGGTMDIDSAPGRGSRFTLIAPSKREELPEKAPESRTSLSFTPLRESKKENGATIPVVLVDDHRVMRQGLASLLSAEQDISIVGEASDGRAAIDLVRDLRPAVVLMDISMPGMDGIEATKCIHAQMPEIKIIGLSMFQEAEQAEAIIAAGALTYLSKTGPSEALIKAIRSCMQDSDGHSVD